MGDLQSMNDLQLFYTEIKTILTEGRTKAYTAVNFAMVEAYWLIGKRIVEEEQKGKDRAGYGEFLIKNLSIELKNELSKGFSVANLKNLRQFYRSFPDFQKSYALCSQLSWSHSSEEKPATELERAIRLIEGMRELGNE